MVSFAGIRARAKRLPLLRNFSRYLIWHTVGRGIFPSHESALRRIPPSRAFSHDSEAATRIVRRWPMLQYRPSDYALLFHLRPLIAPGATVVDLGGSIGITYEVMRQYLEPPPGFTFLVCELPAMVRLARELLRDGQDSALRFTEDLGAVERCDALISSGSLQYIREPIDEKLRQLPHLPRHVILNRVAVSKLPTFYTLQDSFNFTSVYRMQNRDELIESMHSLGYSLRAHWVCTEIRFYVRFHPSTWVNGYGGFYFVRQESPELSGGQTVP